MGASQWKGLKKGIDKARCDCDTNESWCALRNVSGAQEDRFLPISMACLPAATKTHLDKIASLRQDALQFISDCQEVMQTANEIGKQQELGQLDALSKKHNIVAESCSVAILLMQAYSRGQGQKAFVTDAAEFTRHAFQLRQSTDRWSTFLSAQTGRDKMITGMLGHVTEAKRNVTLVDEILLGGWVGAITAPEKTIVDGLERFSGRFGFKDRFVKSINVTQVRSWIQDGNFDDLMDKLGSACDKLKTTTTIVSNYISEQDVTYKVDGVHIKPWLADKCEFLQDGLLCVCLLSAYDLLFEEGLDKTQRASAVADLKPSLISNCSSFPGKVPMILDRWIDVGKADLAITAVLQDS